MIRLFIDRLAVVTAPQNPAPADELRGAGLRVLPSRGSYFVISDFGPTGFRGDDAAFCRHITEHAGVAAIPVSAFYAGDAPRHLARFAVCKADPVLDEASARLARHFAAPRPVELLTAAG